MQLPFTHDQFLDVFGAYNDAFWWAAALLWIATVFVAYRFVRRPEQANGAIGWLLAAHWAWSGAIYHLGYFRAINQPATVFGILFLLEGLLFAWLAVGDRRLDFDSARGAWRVLGLLFIGYSLVYPVLGLGFGLEYPRMPTFGVPCPTVILTIGFLLCANLRAARWIAIIPLVWTVVGGSAAFLLGVRADLALALSGVVLLIRLSTSFGAPGRAGA